MKPTNQIAFKEWAVVCAALASGRQSIILRKGGNDEGRDGFRVEHSEFWLLPTRFHQDASELQEDARPLLQTVIEASLPGKFRIDLYAIVEQVFEIHDLSLLDRIASEHVLSAETVKRRFQYRRPGLFILVPRIYRVPPPHEVADSPYIAGCKSWVDLPEDFSTAQAAPVLNDHDFAQRAERIGEALDR